jgi:hypothetical protein
VPGADQRVEPALGGLRAELGHPGGPRLGARRRA